MSGEGLLERRALLENLPFAIWVVDATGRIPISS